ncbi:hypothetical protein ACU686_04845 [Yinghuangia aomiensis]
MLFGVALCITLVAALRSPADPPRPGTRPLLLGGVADDRAAPGGVAERPPNAAPRRHTAEEQAWLAASTVPGSTPAQREMAGQALVDLRVLTGDDGAVAAAWHGIWKYVWPRDAALGRGRLHGHRTRRRTPPKCCATSPGCSAPTAPGSPLPARRRQGRRRPRRQLDANGWMPWAT